MRNYLRAAAKEVLGARRGGRIRFLERRQAAMTTAMMSFPATRAAGIDPMKVLCEE